MSLLRTCTIILLVGWMTFTAMRAQSPSARVVTVAGVHTATFETPRGTIRIHVSSDAAPGDAVSGTIVSEPAGATPQDKQASLNDLNGWDLDWQGERTPVSAGRYEWVIPETLRTGTGVLILRDRDGRVVSQASIPIDPVAAAPRASPPVDAVELPGEGSIGDTAVIRGRSDGKLTGRAVTLGGATAELLASSPRQLAFRVPAITPGQVPLRFTSVGPAVEGTLRVVDVSVSASRTQLLRNQRATLKVTVRGLSGLTSPMMLTVVNQSPASVQVDGIDRPITIAPNQAVPGGTFVVTRGMTGLQPGPFQIAASVGRPPFAQFDVSRTTTRTLTEWQAATGMGISAEAGEMVRRSALNARADEFLGRQQAYRGDVQDVFAALVSDYLFDLRDNALSRRRAAGPAGAGIMLVAFAQNRAPAVTITEREVGRQSFTDFVSRLTERFTMRQAAGYLFVRSRTPEAPITVDRQQKGNLTDRRFVTPVGDHDIVVIASQTCRQRVTVSAFQTSVVDCAG